MKSKCCNSYPKKYKIYDEFIWGRSAFVGVCDECDKNAEFEPDEDFDDKHYTTAYTEDKINKE